MTGIVVLAGTVAVPTGVVTGRGTYSERGDSLRKRGENDKIK